MKQKSTLVLLAALMVSAVAIGAYAHGGGFAKGVYAGNDNVQQAIADEDYDAFIAALSETDEGARIVERMTEEKFQHMVERVQTHEAIMVSLENEDYDAWVAAVSDTWRGAKLLDVVTEDNFDTFVAMHDAKVAGDWETAKELAEELGIPGGRGHCGNGQHKGTANPESGNTLAGNKPIRGPPSFTGGF